MVRECRSAAGGCQLKVSRHLRAKFSYRGRQGAAHGPADTSLGPPTASILGPAHHQAMKSSISRCLLQHAILLTDIPQQIDNTVGIAPLVVVPAHQLEEAFFAFEVVLERGQTVVN